MRWVMVFCGGILPLLGSVALAQPAAPAPPAPDANPDSSKFVSRDEHEKLKRDFEALKAEFQQYKAAKSAAGVSSADVDQALDEVDKKLRELKNASDAMRPGFTGIYIGGDADAGFTAAKGSKSTFDAALSPLILWKLSDRLLFEGAFDIGISTDDTNSSSTSFDLTIANFSYVVNPYITVGGGLFVVPFGVFHNHYDPPWINKLPDEPLPFGDNGIAPSSEVGFFVEGAIPVDSMKFNYAFYITNGPNIVTSGDGAGTLNFDDFTDLNNNKAFGARIGFLPIRQMEMGYSIMLAQVDPTDFPSTTALLQAVDWAWKQEVDWLMGTIDLRTEWVWSNVNQQTFLNSAGKPFTYENYRNGGYVQASYRPTRTGNKILRNIEPIIRWDLLNQPAIQGGNEQRVTIGLDYWIQPNMVIKMAYVFDFKDEGEDADAFMIQFGIGL